MALPHQSIATISSPQFINLQPLDVNPFMSACEIKVFYVGKNRNGTFISKEAAEEMSKTLRGAPIVGYFKQENQDFRDHGQQMIWDSQGIKFNVLTRPYGFVDPNAHVWFQKFNDTDEFGNTVERQYLMTTGYLWTGQYEEAKMALEDGKPQSMQLDDQSVNGHWAEDAKSGLEFFIINDAIFSKLCILGDDIEPCFEGASITKPSISNTFSKTVDNNFKYTLFTMMQELKNALQGGSIVGSNNDNEENPAEEYTAEEVVETSEVVEETAEQPSEAENVDKEEQIRQALIKFKSNNKIKNEKIFVSIPGQATFNRLITIPPVEAKRIREIVSYEAKQQIPFPLTDVLWDYQVIGSLKEKTTEEREVMLFAVRKEIINNFLANLAAADIRIQGIQIASVAIYNFIRYEKKDLDACVAIDIGAENTDLIVVDNDKLWLRALPFAGNDITKALQKRFNIPYDEAEKLKLKSGKTKQSKKIFEVMKPVLKDIVGEIHRSVGYFKSMSKDVKFEKMIFLGNATKLSGFQEFFSQNLQYDIEILSEINNIHVSPKLNLNLFQSNLTTFAVAIGLALQGVGVSVNNICLLPEEIAIKSLVQNQKKYLGLAVLLLGLVPLILWGTTNQNLTKLQITNQTIDKKLKPINSKVETLNKVKNYQEIQSQLQKFLEVGKDRKVFREILNSFHETLLEASKEIKDNELDEHKFWLLDLSIVKNSELPGTEQITAFYDPILTKVEVAFLSLGDPVEDFEHVGKYFVKKLEDDKHQYKNQKLFNPFGKRSGQNPIYSQEMNQAIIVTIIYQ